MQLLETWQFFFLGRVESISVDPICLFAASMAELQLKRAGFAFVQVTGYIWQHGLAGGHFWI